MTNILKDSNSLTNTNYNEIDNQKFNQNDYWDNKEKIWSDKKNEELSFVYFNPIYEIDNSKK